MRKAGLNDVPLIANRAPAGEPRHELPQDVLNALRFYASGAHFELSDKSAWDTVSGENQNFWCDEAGSATVEDGSIAKAVLKGQPIEFEEPEPAIEGEAFALAAPAAPAPTERIRWRVTGKLLTALANELIRAAESMGYDDELVLEVRAPRTVEDDDKKLNERHVLAVSIAEYPEEGVYPIDPTDPTAGRAAPAPAPPASEPVDFKPLTRFVEHLNEHCVGLTVTEDALVGWLADVLDSTPREVTVRPGPRRLVASAPAPAAQRRQQPGTTQT